MSLPIGYVVPVDRENRWSDLLAVLIESDPVRAGQVLGLGDAPHSVFVRREARAGVRDRIDLLVYVQDDLRAVIEVKVLSGLGPGQLRRYRDAFPAADHHILIFPGRLAVDIADQTGWQGLTWERILASFATSERPWVAETAQAWLDHLDLAVPIVNGHTRWNELGDGEDFVTALRARMSWVFGQLQPPEPITHDLVSSSAGVSWVARMYMPAAKPGYIVIAEAEENLPVRDYPKTVTATSYAVRGPFHQGLSDATGCWYLSWLRLELPPCAMAHDGGRTQRLGHRAGAPEVSSRPCRLDIHGREGRTSSPRNRLRRS